MFLLVLSLIGLGGGAWYLNRSSGGTTRALAARVGAVVGTPQETPWTCGPAALRAVLAHYGVGATEPEVAVAARNMPIIGTRPQGLVRAAGEFGCDAQVTRLADVDAMRPALAAGIPLIVLVDSFTRPGRQSHYVVVSKMDRATVTMMDPNTPGNWRTLTRAEFDGRWWNREPGSRGPEYVRRTAVIVFPPVINEDPDDVEFN